MITSELCSAVRSCSGFSANDCIKFKRSRKRLHKNNRRIRISFNSLHIALCRNHELNHIMRIRDSIFIALISLPFILLSCKKGDLDEYAKLFDIRYVNNSFNLDSSIHKLISGDDPRNYAFDYQFEMMIGLSKIRVIASHYCNVLAFQLLL